MQEKRPLDVCQWSALTRDVRNESYSLSHDLGIEQIEMSSEERVVKGKV
jgi:hypothetical protein